MKPIEGYNKLRGGYYTPDKISEFITEWAVRTPSDTILDIILHSLIQFNYSFNILPLAG